MSIKPFLNLLTADEAYRHIGRMGPRGSETIDPRRAEGRVLAERVCARDDVPHFFRANMDGYAVRAEDTFQASDTSSTRLRLTGQVAMGHEATTTLEPGCTIRVSTGAMMPPGSDAVVMVEYTEEDGTDVLVRSPVVAKQHTIAIGDDMRSGDLVFEAGRRMRGSDVGALCGVGLTAVSVHLVPRVGVIATGDEIVEPGDELAPGQVRNVNEYLMSAMARRMGAIVNDYGVIADDEAVFSRALETAVGECDVVFISGGSSMGTRDLTMATIEGLADSEVLFHGIAIAPGKPTIVARAGNAAIMGVPGNPASAAVVFALFGSAMIRVLEGEPLERVLMNRATVRACLGEDLASTPGREDYVRVRLEPDEGLPRAIPVRGKSASISTIARADGLLRIPLSSEGIEKGSEVDVILLD